MNSLLEACAELVQRNFGSSAVAAAIAGSHAAGCPREGSDIDVFVVVADETPLDSALQGRVRFTTGYVRVHHTLAAVPDLKWPAEVFYARDLEATLEGAAYRLREGRITRVPLSQPYRYWMTMLAANTPVAGGDYLAARAADAWRSMVAYELARRVSAGSRSVTDVSLVSERRWEEQWRVRRAFRRYGNLIGQAIEQLAAEGMLTPVRDGRWRIDVDAVGEWVAAQRPAPSEPVLDAYEGAYRRAAEAASALVSSRAA